MAAIETRPNKPHKTWLVAELKQPIAENTLYVCVARRSAKGVHQIEPVAALASVCSDVIGSLSFALATSES